MTMSSERDTVTATSAPPGLTALAVDGLARVDAQEWDRLLGPGSGALGHGFLQAWECSELSGLRSRPVLAYEPGSSLPVAASPGYYYDLDAVGVRAPAAARLLRSVRQLRPRFLMMRTYELGSPTPLANPFLVRDTTPRSRAVEAIVDAAVEEARRGKAQFLLIQNTTSLHGPAGEHLLGLGFAGVPIFPTAVVDLPYRSFDEYLGAMRAQYRRRANQTLKRSGELKVEQIRAFGDLAEELSHLWRLIYDRARELRREVLTPAFFRAAAELDDTSALLLRRPDGSIASFGLLLDDGPWLSFLQCGFDEEAGRTEGAYFRLLYEIIRLGIEQGFEQVDLGVTTLTPKLDVGAVPVPLFAFVKHRIPVVQRLIRLMGEGPLRPDPVQPRRVFKDAPPSAPELVARRGLIV